MKNDARKEMSLPFSSELLQGVNVSFEFFPPNTVEMDKTLWESIKLLAPVNPSFVSVTYGAGGSTRKRTHEVLSRVKKETNLEVAAHLTCIGSEKVEIAQLAEQYWSEGISHIVALRGDLPLGYKPGNDEYKHANELVTALKKIHDFEISVAGYPEKHPEAFNMEVDLDHLMRKVDAGADRIISQFFMEPKHFLNFLDKAAARGINVPIVPGILPISNFASAQRFAKLCGASVPAWLADLFEGLDARPDTRRLIAAAVAVEQCRILLEHGIKDFHFYTLNRAELTLGICHLLGKRN